MKTFLLRSKKNWPGRRESGKNSRTSFRLTALPAIVFFEEVWSQRTQRSTKDTKISFEQCIVSIVVHCVLCVPKISRQGAKTQRTQRINSFNLIIPDQIIIIMRSIPWITIIKICVLSCYQCEVLAYLRQHDPERTGGSYL